MFNHGSLLSPYFPALTYRNISSTSWSDYACHVDMHLYLKWNKSATAVCVVNLVQLYIEFVPNIQRSKSTGLYLLSMLQLAIASGHPAAFLKKKMKRKKKDIFVIFKFSTGILLFPPILHWFSYALALSKCQPDLKWLFLFLKIWTHDFYMYESVTFLVLQKDIRTITVLIFFSWRLYIISVLTQRIDCVQLGGESNTGKWEGEHLWIRSAQLYLYYRFLISQWQNKDSSLLS